LRFISDQVARNFRLRPDDLQSRTREQPITFARQLAMFLCRKMTGAPFETIGEHFNRDHSTVIQAYQLIERLMVRDAAFRLFIEKLGGQITGTCPLTARREVQSWRSLDHTQITVISDVAADRCGSTAIFYAHTYGAP
jgi:hypothetical protein